MKTKHTPGPWSVLGDQIGHGSFIHASDSVHNKIAQDVMNPADARLIAAAPELLQALIAMQATAGTKGPDAKRALDMAYEAIAKAEGK